MKRLPFDKKPKKKKLRDISNMKNDAWNWFSKHRRLEFINEHGIVLCFTCEEPHHWKDIQGGHFIHGHYKLTFLVVENVHPQCVRCNKHLDGNRDEYAYRMVKKYGADKIIELNTLSKQQWKPTREYYQEMINKYKPLVLARLEIMDGLNNNEKAEGI